MSENPYEGLVPVRIQGLNSPVYLRPEVANNPDVLDQYLRSDSAAKTLGAMREREGTLANLQSIYDQTRGNIANMLNNGANPEEARSWYEKAQRDYGGPQSLADLYSAHQDPQRGILGAGAQYALHNFGVPVATMAAGAGVGALVGGPAGVVPGLIYGSAALQAPLTYGENLGAQQEANPGEPVSPLSAALATAAQTGLNIAGAKFMTGSAAPTAIADLVSNTQTVGLKALVKDIAQNTGMGAGFGVANQAITDAQAGQVSPLRSYAEAAGGGGLFQGVMGGAFGIKNNRDINAMSRGFGQKLGAEAERLRAGGTPEDQISSQLQALRDQQRESILRQYGVNPTPTPTPEQEQTQAPIAPAVENPFAPQDIAQQSYADLAQPAINRDAGVRAAFRNAEPGEMVDMFSRERTTAPQPIEQPVEPTAPIDNPNQLALDLQPRAEPLSPEQEYAQQLAQQRDVLHQNLLTQGVEPTIAARRAQLAHDAWQQEAALAAQTPDAAALALTRGLSAEQRAALANDVQTTPRDLLGNPLEQERRNGNQTQGESQVAGRQAQSPDQIDESLGGQGGSDRAENGQANAAPQGQEVSPDQLGLRFPVEQQTDMFAGQPQQASPTTPLTELPVREGSAPATPETPAQAMSRMVDSNRAKVRGDIEAKRPVNQVEAAARTANATTVKSLTPKIQERMQPGDTSIAPALGRLLADPKAKLSPSERNAATMAHQRMTGGVKPAEQVQPTQRTMFGPKGGIAKNAEEPARVMNVLNPDMERGRLLDATDIPARASDAAAWLGRTMQEPWMRDLARKLQPYLDNVPVRVASGLNDESVPIEARKAIADGAGGVTLLYPSGKTEIYLSDFGMRLRDDTLLHELLHGATERALADPKHAATLRELSALKDQFVKSLEAEGHPQAKFFTDIFNATPKDDPTVGTREFVTYALTSPTLREFGAKLDSYGRSAGVANAAPKLNWMQRFTNAIAKLFGMATKRIGDIIAAPSGKVVRVGSTTPDFHARLDAILNKTLEARGDTSPFSRSEPAAVAAAQNVSLPTQRNTPYTMANQAIAARTPSIATEPTLKERADTIARQTGAQLSSFGEKTINRVLDSGSHLERQLHIANDGKLFDAQTKLIRADVAVRQNGDANQVVLEAARRGGIRVGADGRIELFDAPENMQKVIKDQQALTARTGMTNDQATKLISTTGQALRMRELGDLIDEHESSLPEVDKDAVKRVAQAQIAATEAATGEPLSDAAKADILKSAGNQAYARALEKVGLTPSDAAQLRSNIEKWKAAIRMTPAQIEAAIAEGAKHPEVARILKTYREMTRNAVNFMHDTGRIDAATRDALNSPEYYFSFGRDMGDTDLTTGAIKSGANPRGKFLSLDLHPNENAINDVHTNMRNQLDWMIRTGLQNNTNRIGATSAIAHDMGVVHNSAPYDPADRAKTVGYFDNGKQKFVTFHNALDAEAYRGTTRVMHPMLNGMSRVARFVRTMVVAADPSFAIRQNIMDASSAGLLSGASNPFKVMGDTLGMGFKYAAQIAKGGAPDDPYAVGLRKYGQTGRFDTIQSSDNDMYRALQNAPTSTWGLLKDKGQNLVHAMESLASGMELAQRTAVYKNLLAQGKSDLEAYYAAHELINYNRTGSDPIMSVLSQTVPFMHSKMAATHLYLRLLQGQSINGASRAQCYAQLARNFAMLGGMSMVYAMLTGDNEQVQDVPLEQRYRNFIIPLGGGHNLFIPVRPEVGVLFKWVPEQLWQYHKNQLPDAELTALKNGGDALAKAFMFDAPVPAAIKPLVENQMNYSFHNGAPLVSPYLQQLPADLQFNSGTSELAKRIGSAIGVSPIKLDNVIRGYTGSLSSYLSSASYHLAAQFDPNLPAHDWSQEPGIQGFVKSSMSSQAVNDFYNFAAQIQAATSAYKRASDEGRIDDATKLLSEHRNDISSATVMRSLTRQMQSINQAIRNIQASNLPNDSKLMQVNGLKELRRNLAQQAEKLPRD